MVVKIGGSMAEDRDCLEELAADLSRSFSVDRPLVLVHGGGKDINRNLQWLGQSPHFLDGLRVTDEAAMDVVEMTLSGRVNKLLVRLLLATGAKAAGISGVDGALLRATPLRADGGLGQVGRVTSCDPAILHSLWGAGFLPVVSPVSLGPDGRSWNVNADDAASFVAQTLDASCLVYISDVPGVLRLGEPIPWLDALEIEEMISSGVATGGMIPKLRGCAATLVGGAQKVVVSGWSGPGSLDRMLEGKSGTTIQFREES